MIVVAALMCLASCKKEPVTPSPKPGPDPVDPTPVVVDGDGHFSGGYGSMEKPYLIATVTDLDSVSVYTNKGKFLDSHFKQTADIDMSVRSGFKPIAQDGNPFKGTYDGAGFTIKALRIDNQATKAAGLFAYAEGANIKNITLADARIDSKYTYCGGIVGHIKAGTTVNECSVSGKVQAYEKALTVESVSNAGFSGGIVGHAENSTVNRCVLAGEASFYGQYSGGIVGDAVKCTISHCQVLPGAAVNVYYHYNGGIVARVSGAGSYVKDCSFEGNLTSCGNTQGGIVGYITAGEIENCVLGSHAAIGADKYYVGGIVGFTNGTDIKITKCASYGKIRGQYAVGGIVGIMKGGSVTRCASVGARLTGTGNNGGSNLYSLVSGIAGWTSANNCTISNCLAAPEYVETISNGNRGALGGISGYQNSTAAVVYENCVSTLDAAKIINRGDIATQVTGDFFYGAIYARVTQSAKITNCYYDSSIKIGPQEGKAVETGCKGMTYAELNSQSTVALLNDYAKESWWTVGTDGALTLVGLPADPNPSKKASKRVSVIGDSISTFKGWIPSGYSAHYPATDGTLTTVDETYWYRLVYGFMKDAEFDTNIAFSGSTVTNTTDANYAARYGSASNTWWHNSYTERFAACGGCGKPDIILIHGGTNDFSHNADPLAPGLAIRNDASNMYGGSAPSPSVMNAIFAKADAAKTRAEVNALPDGTFCEAYVKLLCQIRERYPKCKVVCIIGDYLNQAIEQSTIQIADHYGAKCVNLFRVNGFNDLGGYTPTTLTNKGRQPNMPKHDYSGDLSGCHPGSKAMEFIANKIYTELGSWLEE